MCSGISYLFFLNQQPQEIKKQNGRQLVKLKKQLLLLFIYYLKKTIKAAHRNKTIYT